MAERKLIVEIVGDASSFQRSLGQASRATGQFDRSLSASLRGVAAGSGVFRSLGRSIVFASGGFLAFGGAAAFVRKTIDAAKEAQVANAQLATQLTANGRSFAQYRDQIDQTVSRLSALAGIQDDELKSGLTTILRTVPNVSKALRDLGLAADLSRARHISLSQAAIILAKTEAGNTTLLRRQGFQIKQNATVEEALAVVRAKVVGQAKAGTTEQERFGAVLHQTEEIIGTALLPTLNKYLASGSKWLEQMNESGKLQHDVASAAHDFAAAVGAAADVVKAADEVTGSFKNTLKLLLEIKVASIVLGWAKAMNLFAAAEVTASESAVVSRINAYTGAVSGTGAAAATSAKQVGGLKAALGGLGLIQIAPILIPIELAVSDKERSFLDKLGRGGSLGKALLDIGTGGVSGNLLGDLKDAVVGKSGKQTLVDTSLSATKGLGPHSAALISKQVKAAVSAANAAVTKTGLTATQRNTFFDNAISRILLRGGLGDIGQQIAALQKADSLIQARLKITKDVTRKQNLEDELLQNAAQIRSLQGQQVADRLQQQADARQKAIDALQARADARKSRQFRELGLTATGDDPVAGVAALKRRLGQLTANVTSSNLNTPKLQSELARFRKVLNEGLVPKDVRAKIKEMMDGIAAQIKDSSTNGPLTKTTALSTNAVLKGLGIDAKSERIIRARLSHFNSAGVSLTGSGTGSQSVTVNAPPVYLDGRLISKNVGKHQARTRKRNASQRNGPNAGIVFD